MNIVSQSAKYLLIGLLAARPLAIASAPEDVGFSSERLRRLDDVMQGMIERKENAGMVVVGTRHGHVFIDKTYGMRDLASAAPMRRDTVFRIHSMSKVITGVAMMMLYEEGKWRPQDPISRYIPEFAHLKVFRGLDAAGKPLLEDPIHPPTMRELMTHTAGFAYGSARSPVERMYFGKSGKSTTTPDGPRYDDDAVLASHSLQQMIDRLAQLPLFYQPGTRWFYGISCDVQGYLVQKLSGLPLGEFLRQRLFTPLGMKDSGFYIPGGDGKRLATLYMKGADGELVAHPHFGGRFSQTRYDRPPELESGGGGMVSTAEDYLRFAQMLLDNGALHGVRILGPSTVTLLRSNHLGDALLNDPRNVGAVHRIRPGFGWGYDVGVYTAPTLADSPVGVGTYMWRGAAGPFFWVDPTNDIVFVCMTQKLDEDDLMPLEEAAKQVVYQALVAPGT